MDRSMEDLRDQFFRALDEKAPEGTALWHQVWRVLLSHPWYQDELRRAAFRTLRPARLHLQWIDDVKQEAMLLLARDLRHSADLHVDRAAAEEHFAAWLRKIIMRHCQQAARSMRRAQRRAGLQQAEVLAAASKSLPLDSILDLALAIRKLPKASRRVLLLRLRGWGIVEITQRVHRCQTEVHRALAKGLSKLRRPDSA
jgi:DNA-directed RNA polymerase specialized sigma24 family protein